MHWSCVNRLATFTVFSLYSIGHCLCLLVIWLAAVVGIAAYFKKNTNSKESILHDQQLRHSKTCDCATKLIESTDRR